MFVLSKRKIIIPAPDGGEPLRLERDVMTQVPDWAAETPYFKELAADGKIVPTGTSDREEQRAAEKKVRTRRGEKVTEE